MSTPDLSAKLPPPHDEEPAQLRSDILDELQDHLSCAVDRERRRLQLSDQPVDPASVWAAVIDRFGDPSALARRLWFDAMKGRLMTQRVLIGAVLVLTVLMVVGGWSMTSTLSAVVEQNQKANAAILERLSQESPASVTSSPEWVAVKYRLVQGTADGPPVVGQKVSFQQFVSNGAGRLNQISEITNSDGVADFGLLPYGTYNVSISSPAGMMGEGVTFRPGRPIDTKIIVPHAPQMVHVKFEYTRPDMTGWKWFGGNQPENLTPCLCIQYRPLHPTRIDGKTWGWSAFSGILFVTPEGMFNVNSGSTDRFSVSSPAIDSVIVPAIEMEVQAEWYFLSGHSVDSRGIPTQEAFYMPMTSSLDTSFILENRKVAGGPPDSMPVVLQLKSTPDPQVISLPGNHPSLIDGTGISSPLFFGGAGGFSP